MPNDVSAAQLNRAEPQPPVVPDALPAGRPWIHRLAVATAVATYLLILIGGLVHGTGSSLACPDWPTCYGTFMPKMEGGVLVEHSHRLAAGTVVILTLVLAGALSWAGRRVDGAGLRPAESFAGGRGNPPRVPAYHDALARRLRPFGWLAVALVFAQALLGGITVLLRLPTPISTAHTATSLLFFMTVLYIAVRSRPERATPPAAAPPMVARAALMASAAVYVQMVLGGLVRHSGAALACTDVPLCRGSFWPHAHPTVLIQALHRLNAMAVAAVVLVSAVISFRQARRPVTRALALVAPLLVGVQIWLGIRSVQSFLDLVTVESHLAVATALLATLILTALTARPAVRPQFGGLAWLRGLVALGKPRITGLVVITFAGGLWLAPGSIAQWRAIMTLIGTAFLVAAANTFNMYLERDVDPLMERTRGRPLPRGILSPETSLVFGALLACFAIPLVFLGSNFLTGLLGLTALGSYVLVYTPLKRHSAAALFIGAIPGALPPLMGWTAVTGRLEAPGVALFAILFCWQIPHFCAIAIYRAGEYARAGFKVLPARVSNATTLATMLAFSIGLVAATLVLGPLHVAGTAYLACAFVLGAIFIAWSAAGYRRGAAAGWARGLFLYSLLYLTVLFVALALGRTVA
jgi:protoheme IX farnesyltransferase